jgi:hypothetical protein
VKKISILKRQKFLIQRWADLPYPKQPRVEKLTLKWEHKPESWRTKNFLLHIFNITSHYYKIFMSFKVSTVKNERANATGAFHSRKVNLNNLWMFFPLRTPPKIMLILSHSIMRLKWKKSEHGDDARDFHSKWQRQRIYKGGV